MEKSTNSIANKKLDSQKLVQKPFYFSSVRKQAIYELMKSLDIYKIDPQASLILRELRKPE